MKLAALALILATNLACGAGQKPATIVDHEAARQFPVLAHVPASATWFLATARLDRGVDFLSNLVQPLLSSGDQPWNVLFGHSPFTFPDLGALGFDRDRSAALYAVGLLPTLMLPVADDAAVDQYVESLIHELTVQVVDYRGVHLTSWGAETGLTASWGIVGAGVGGAGRWLAIHVRVASLEAEPNRWLDLILDAHGGVAVEPDVAWALAQAGPRQDALGLLRYPVLLAELARIEIHGAPTGVGRVAFFARLGERDADTGAYGELEPRAHAQIAAAISPAPALFARLRDEAAVYFAIGVDLARLDTQIARLVDLNAIQAVRVAILAARPTGAAVDVRAAAWARLTQVPELRRMLDEIFPAGQRSHETAGGRDLESTSLPRMSQPLEWTLAGDDLRAAVGPDLAAELAQSPIQADDELFAFRFERERIGDIAAVASLLGLAEPFPVSDLERCRAVYRRVRFGLTLAPGGIRMEGAFELR